MLVAIFIMMVGTLAVLVWGSASIHSGLYLHALCRSRLKERCVALTFDDGPDLQHTPELLDLLQRRRVRVTFFVIGEKAAAHPDLLRRMMEEGHTIGIHTYTHSGRFPLLCSSRMREELQATAEVIHRITGRRPRLFRPPFGVTNPQISCAVKQLGLQTIGWSIRSLDTLIRIPREKILKRVVRHLHPGAVILLHDRCPECVQLTEMLLDALEQYGYYVNTVEPMFDINAYED